MAALLSLLGHALACLWRPLTRVLTHRRVLQQKCSSVSTPGCVLGQIPLSQYRACAHGLCCPVLTAGIPGGISRRGNAWGQKCFRFQMFSNVGRFAWTSWAILGRNPNLNLKLTYVSHSVSLLHLSLVHDSLSDMRCRLFQFQHHFCAKCWISGFSIRNTECVFLFFRRKQ